MALNLMTPRYVAPDVTKAPLAAESIRSSQASTNLAAQAQATRDRAQQAQEQQFRAQLGLSAKEQAEASAARRGNLALGWERADQGWEELSLRAEAQSVNLANTEQQMRHREDRLPFEIDALALANEAQNLKNELDDATMDEQKEKIALGNKNLRADIMTKRASARSINQATNLAETNQATKERQEGNFASYQSQMDAAINMGYYDFIQDMVFEDVNPAQAQSLREMQTKIAGREASKAAMAAANRQNVNAINQSTANQAVIGKLPTVAMQGFWRQANVTNFSGNTQYTDGNGMLTPEGQAALSAQAEWLGLNLEQADIDKLMTMPVGSSQGQGWLLSGNPAGEKFLNGSMFIPTEEALQEAKALKAKQRATFQANIIPTEFSYEKYGVQVKGKSIGEMSKESQQAHMDSVADTYKALLATDEYTGVEGHRKAWANAVMQSKTNMGKIAFIAPNDLAAFHKVKGGEMYFDAQDLSYKIKPHTKVGTGGPPTTSPPTPATAEFDPLPLATDERKEYVWADDDSRAYDGPQNKLWEARKTINQTLTSNGMSQKLATWLIGDGADDRGWGRTLADNWETRDDLLGLIEQGRRRMSKKALDRKELIAEAVFDRWSVDADNAPDAHIRLLSGYLDKPIDEWPTLDSGAIRIPASKGGKAKSHGWPTMTTAAAEKLKKLIPQYILYADTAAELENHMKHPAYEGQSKEY